MKPLIAVPSYHYPDIGSNHSDLFANKSVTCKSLSDAGAAVVTIPHTNNEEDLERVLSCVDGIFLEGGEHIHPSNYGEEIDERVRSRIYDQNRDEIELMVLKYAMDNNIPVFAVCRGYQLLNVYFGGKLTQYLDDEQDKLHNQPLSEVARNALVHGIRLVNGSSIESMIEKDEIKVNSRHAQAVKVPGNGLSVVAHSEDGLIEAVESITEGRFILGVAWHPEDLFDENSAKLFRAFINACQKD